ncbi:hypothetical protein KSX_21770 [Ktedonospora formicarum]|uniref:Uncharacterized protein n=1 Tax=Ktedonospora formicarum TaxID=2778364 RepID=A0A8J3I1Z0_9CHLR|nr:hypothetical protein KSX_21770 [Ktedonospora formicarum]
MRTLAMYKKAYDVPSILYKSVDDTSRTKDGGWSEKEAISQRESIISFYIRWYLFSLSTLWRVRRDRRLNSPVSQKELKSQDG